MVYFTPQWSTEKKVICVRCCEEKKDRRRRRDSASVERRSHRGGIKINRTVFPISSLEPRPQLNLSLSLPLPQETYDFLKSVCPDVRLCRGNFDGSEVVAAANAAAAASAASEASSSCSSPSSSAAAFVAASGDETVLSVGGLRLGLAPAPADEDSQGNASDLLARRLGVDVLVSSSSSGGSTQRQQHELRAGARRGRLFVSPGSATGAWSPPSSSSPSSSSSASAPSPAVPSFVLMDCSEGRAVVYMYRLLPGDELKVEKLEYRKSGGAAASPSTAKKAAAAPTAAAPAAAAAAAAAAPAAAAPAAAAPAAAAAAATTTAAS